MKSAQRELPPPGKTSSRKSREAVVEVREILQAYAHRGIFRGFSESTSGRGLPTFTFVWMLQHPMELAVDVAKHTLRFKQLLPGVPVDSVMYAELKEFLQAMHDAALPEHRRIDPRRAEVGASNRGGFVSVSLKIKKSEYAWGVNRIVNVVHELFVHLRDACPDYLMENFDVPRE